MDENTALSKAKAAYEHSTQYVESSLREGWEANERQFQSRHPKGSKYESDDYKFRSKNYRPKTRATIQSNEADCAFAFFSTTRLTDVSPIDDNDDTQKASAAINRELLQYRLTHSIPWFDIVLGGFQDCEKNDICFAHSYWAYRQKTKKVQVPGLVDTPFGPVEGMVEQEDVEVLEDKPVCELIPPENIRIDPSSDWTNPVQKSPYLIHLIPMTVDAIRTRMKVPDPKTQEPKWKTLTKEEIQSASETTYDPLKQEREFNRTDPNQKKQELSEYDTVFVHRNFIREEGEDWLFYTIGTKELLSKPVKAKEVYWHLLPGERPYVMGNVAIEAHKPFPEGSVCQLTRDLSREINDHANLRLDNVKLAVNGLYGVKRTANVDYDALRQGIPGSGILMDNPETDVMPIPKADVTSSSYAEQDRMDADFGDISGAFSPSNVMTNRKLGETVGGMQMISASATKVGDYRILTYAKKFLEPLLGQLVRLEQAYETDEVVLAIAAKKANLFQRFHVDQVTDQILRQQLTTTVNVGISSTDPTSKVNRLLTGMTALQKITDPASPLGQMIDLKEIGPEVFGSLGYQDGMRFFRFSESGEDPRIMQLMQTIEQLQKAIETKQVEEAGRNQRMQELQDKKTQENLVREDMKGRTSLMSEQMKSETALMTTAMTAHASMNRPHANGG